jgi:tRNA (mo5U34)-methyltransferase
MSATETSAASARRALEANPVWYHTLELAPGVVTPGYIDLRPVAPRLLAPDLHGLRALDVGTFDGFWAFELERRGAREVLGIDVLDPHRWDWPVGSDEETVRAIGLRMASGDGFEVARAALGSSVTRLDRSVYDLDPAEVGRFDLVYLGSLLVHLRDPVAALERVRSVCDGTIVVVDGIDLPLTLRAPRIPVSRLDARGRPWWWYPNLAGLGRLVEAGGFELVERPRALFVPPGPGWRPSRWNARALRSREGRYWLTAAWLGDPHGVLVARPKTPGRG